MSRSVLGVGWKNHLSHGRKTQSRATHRKDSENLQKGKGKKRQARNVVFVAFTLIEE